MTAYTPRLVAAGLRRGYRPADPDRPRFDGGPWCCDCHGPMGEDWSCACRPHGIEATESEPDLGAIVAHFESLGIAVVDRDDWFPVHAPEWLAELEAEAGVPHISHRAERMPDHIDL